MTRLFTTLIALLLLATPVIQAAETKAPEKLLVPRATKSPRVDGKLGKTEWAEAVQVALADGGQARLLHDGKYLFIAMVGKKAGTGSVCVRWEQSVFALHASSALGELRFTPKDGKWIPNRDRFQFSNRDTTESQKGIRERKSFLQTHRWFASTRPDAAGLEREYQIELGGKRQLQLVLSFLSFVGDDEFDLDAWPTTVVDGCAELSLASGYVNREFTFQPETWGVVVMR